MHKNTFSKILSDYWYQQNPRKYPDFIFGQWRTPLEYINLRHQHTFHFLLPLLCKKDCRKKSQSSWQEPKNCCKTSRQHQPRNANHILSSSFYTRKFSRNLQSSAATDSPFTHNTISSNPDQLSHQDWLLWGDTQENIRCASIWLKKQTVGRYIF